MSPSGRVGIVVLNWNGWQDTIVCLESLFRTDYPAFTVIVCDNGSEDGSLEKIAEWAEGRRNASTQSSDTAILMHVVPAVPKPIPYHCYDREELLSLQPADTPQVPLLLINNGSNLGFAGGNNTALSYLLAQGVYSYAWVLNNDTVVDSRALTELVNAMSLHPTVGICGSLLLRYDRPELVQSAGARYNQWLGVVKHLGYDQRADSYTADGRWDYLVGASMLVSTAFIRDIGLMSEDYFIYYEELDWIKRAKGNYDLYLETKSIVYHKEGATVGSSSSPGTRRKSLTADFYAIRNRLLYTKKYIPLALPTIYLSLIASIMIRCARREFSHALMVLRIMLGLQSKP